MLPLSTESSRSSLNIYFVHLHNLSSGKKLEDILLIWGHSEHPVLKQHSAFHRFAVEVANLSLCKQDIDTSSNQEDFLTVKLFPFSFIITFCYPCLIPV